MSLAKDLPFAGLYWSLLEPTRGAMLRWVDVSKPADSARSSSAVLGANILSAGVLLCLVLPAYRNL